VTLGAGEGGHRPQVQHAALEGIVLGGDAQFHFQPVPLVRVHVRSLLPPGGVPHTVPASRLRQMQADLARGQDVIDLHLLRGAQRHGGILGFLRVLNDGVAAEVLDRPQP
jgi:hypothetical protein